MKVLVLGAGVVGTATAYYLAKFGCDVEVVERQEAAALETSRANGGVIHLSEVQPWAQPGMPTKILRWLGKEDAPLLLRYGAIPHMWRWGLDFLHNCTPEKSRRHSLANLGLAKLSLQSIQELRSEHPLDYDLRSTGVLKSLLDARFSQGRDRSCEGVAAGRPGIRGAHDQRQREPRAVTCRSGALLRRGTVFPD